MLHIFELLQKLQWLLCPMGQDIVPPAAQHVHPLLPGSRKVRPPSGSHPVFSSMLRSTSSANALALQRSLHRPSSRRGRRLPPVLRSSAHCAPRAHPPVADKLPTAHCSLSPPPYPACLISHRLKIGSATFHCPFGCFSIISNRVSFFSAPWMPPDEPRSWRAI